MSTVFISNLKVLLEEQNNVSTTENGGKGYKTTKSAATDIFFGLSGYRNKSILDIKNDFKKVCEENLEVAFLFAFYVGDIRQGAGERRTYLNMLDYLAEHYPAEYKKVMKLIPEYSRWDYLWRVTEATEDGDIRAEVINIIRLQLVEDMSNYEQHKPISLLAKWLPSENASSEATKKMATDMRIDLNMTSKQYRKMLSELRAYIDLTEQYLCDKRLEQLDYSKVPSKANLKYKKAFMRNDTERYMEYIESVNNGEAKMNSKVTNPCEIVNEYIDPYGWGRHKIKETDDALEAMWKSLKRDKKCGNILPILDGSGSMYGVKVANAKMDPETIAVSIAIYLAEQNEGPFKDLVMAFGSHNDLLSMASLRSLREKIIGLQQITDCGTTNIELVFNNILQTAVNNHLKQKDLPETLVIISDMEFNRALTNASDKDFAIYKQRFESHGFKLPKLIFWNVMGRTNTMPMIKNDYGVILMSGFSTNMIDMVISDKLDPTEALMERLYSERYNPVLEALK